MAHRLRKKKEEEEEKVNENRQKVCGGIKLC